MNASSSEAEDFRDQFLNVVWQDAYPLVVESMLLTLHAVLTAYFIWRRCMDRKTNPRAIYMILISLTMFSLSATYWGLDMYYLLESIWDTADHVAGTTGLVPISVARDDEALDLQLAQQFVACAILLCGDYVVLWRACALYRNPRWLCVVSLVLAVMSTAIYSTLVAFRHQDVGRVVNIVPNLIATLLVTYKTWLHWKDVHTLMPQMGTERSVIVLLMIVLESGFVHSALTTSYAIILFAIGDEAARWLSYVLIPLFAMYPTLVVVLVAARKNYLEQTIVPISSSSLQRGMAFASVIQDSDYGIRTRRSMVRRMDSDMSSRESIIPLNVSFGPTFDPGVDLDSDAKYGSASGDHLIVMEQPLVRSRSASIVAAQKMDSVVIVDAVGHGSALSESDA
ncbi:unnamed protein product [Peniophora sp. CBMAI 1063]|nr:unnamed protein product [Peniophora sp. CBMAI 1063]